MTTTCTHLDQIREVTPSANGCCDSSPNRHATKHFHETGHPIMQSFQPGEDWLWCYVDEVIMESA